MKAKKIIGLIYCYVVCGTSLWFFGYYGWVGTWGIKKIINPNGYLAYHNRNYVNLDSFKMSYLTWKEGDKEKLNKMSDDEWKKIYESKRESEIEYIKNEGRNQLHNFIYQWLITIPFFIFHWKKAESICKEPGTENLETKL